VLAAVWTRRCNCSSFTLPCFLDNVKGSALFVGVREGGYKHIWWVVVANRELRAKEFPLAVNILGIEMEQ